MTIATIIALAALKAALWVAPCLTAAALANKATR